MMSKALEIHFMYETQSLNQHVMLNDSDIIIIDGFHRYMKKRLTQYGKY